MASIFTEEDLYDMGFEPFGAGDEDKILAAFTKLAESPRSSEMGIEQADLTVYPAIGVSVPFPGQMIQLEAATPIELAIARTAYDKNLPLFIGVSTDDCLSSDSNLLAYDRVCQTGCLGRIVGFREDGTNPGAMINVVLGERALIDVEATYALKEKSPFGASVVVLPELKFKETASTRRKLLECRIKFGELLKRVGSRSTSLLGLMLQKAHDPVTAINFMAMHTPGDRVEKYALLEAKSISKRLDGVDALLDKAFIEWEIRQKVVEKANEQMSRQRRDNYLRNQMDAIRSELGENYEENTDVAELLGRAEAKAWSPQADAHFRKELKKMERYNVTMPEYSIQYSYLETFLNLPWERVSPTSFTLDEVRKSLDEDHYGLEKVKERIVEHVAVAKLRADMKSPILCLSGPPGIGKTSLGKSIAKALGREYQRIALGGVSDEAEVRGHRRTYVGAMAGRIIAALAKCQSNNPVIVLDEIDKIGKGLRGDPGQALLEVLDPEQNTAFHDNYLDFDYDLSKVFFIATANNISEVSEPLLDRMEVIPLSGYIQEEKVEISKRHLVPKSLEKNGFGQGEVKINVEGLNKIVEGYTRESGVRQLEKKIESVLRKLACRKVEGMPCPKSIGAKEVSEILGKEDFQREVYEDNSYAGVVTGLAWTATGGEILFVETSVSDGKGEKLTLTGNLGNVMKESATIALEYLRSHPYAAGIDYEKMKKSDIHIHVPEGAVPKDGPSAGITITTSIASALTGRKVRANLAMTGEMTLRGKVLPVGGIKEKILAAQRAGIKIIMLSSKNRKDIAEIPQKYLEEVEFRYVDHIREVLEYALLDEKAER